MFNLTTFINSILVIFAVILLSCQKSDDGNWVTYNPQSNSKIQNNESGEITTTSPSEQRELNTSEITPKNTASYKTSDFISINNLLEIEPFLLEHKATKITANELYHKGFDLETHVPYPRQSLRLESTIGTFSTDINENGIFHIGALVYDSPGIETFELLINENKIGKFNAVSDNNREILFVTKEIFELKENDKIIFKSDLSNTAGSPTKTYRTHRADAIILIPQIVNLHDVPFIHKINNLDIKNIKNENEPSLYLTWTTTWKTKCTVTLNFTDNSYANVIESDQYNNHRLNLNDISNLKQFKLVCPSTSKNISSEWITPTILPENTNNNDPNYKVQFTVSNIQTKPFDDLIPIIVSVPVEKSKWWTNSFTVIHKTSKIPHQTTPLSYWEDQSIKWLLIEFYANIPINQQSDLEISASNLNSPSTSKYLCSDLPNSVIMDNNKIKLTLNESNALFESIYFDKNQDGIISNSELISNFNDRGFIAIKSPDGKEYRFSGDTKQIELLKNGPITCLIAVTNFIEYADDQQLKSRFEIEIYKNQDWVVINHTIGFVDDIVFKSISFDLPLSKANYNHYEISTDNSSHVSKTPDLKLFQIRDDAWELKSKNKNLGKGKRALGWASANTSEYSITISNQNFWQQWPKSLSISKSSLSLGLFPEINSNITKPQNDIELTKSLYYFEGNNYRLPKGLEKTHQIILSFGINKKTDYSLLKLRGNTSAAHVNSTNVLGKVAGLDNIKTPFYKHTFNEMLNKRLVAVEKNKEYGILNFGDWYGEREVNWGNNEYDTPHGLFQNWLLGGPEISFVLAEQAVTHMKNIDVINSGEAIHIGKMYKHSIGHLGLWFPKSFTNPPLNSGFYKSTYTTGHTWINGLLDHYNLTGDVTSLNTALKIADNQALSNSSNYEYLTAREAGSFLLIMTAAYNQNHDKFYLNAARIAVDRINERENKLDGGWDRIITSEDCNVNPPNIGEKSFMTGLLLSGLKQYHQITRDPKVSEMIVKASERLVKENWNNNIIGFKRVPCKNVAYPYPTNPNSAILEGLGYAWRLTGNLSLAKPILLNAMLLESFSGAKDFSRATRFAHQTLYDQLEAQKYLQNLYSEKGINLILKPSSKQKTIVAFSSQNSSPENFGVTISNDLDSNVDSLTLSQGYGKTSLDNDKKPTYKLNIKSQTKSGINILSNASTLQIDASERITLLGQKPRRTFWIKTPNSDTGITINLDSKEMFLVKIKTKENKLIKECNANQCILKINSNNNYPQDKLKIEITNSSDAYLTIKGISTYLSVFENQL